jgi:hypothetical protein
MMNQIVNALGAMVGHLAQRLSNAWRDMGQSLQPQRWVPVAFVGLFLLANSVDSSSLNQSTKDALNDLISRGENGRPVTTRQWQAERDQLKGKPGKKAERISKETVDAVDEMTDIYPGNAKTLTPGMENRSLEKDE